MSDLLAAPLPHTGELLAGRYRLIERIGAGGMGRVYRARDELLGRDVALKLFFQGEGGEADAARRASEARVLASLNHPCLVTLYDAQVTAADQAYLVMELIDGPTLRHVIEDGPIDPSDVARLLQDLAGGLAAVHRAGVVHRDVKPSNVLLRSEPGSRPLYRAVLADFGVAHLVDGGRLTTPGTVIGTAAYLAPEQVHGGEPTTASDVYALGLLTLEALSRLHPFGTHSAPATLLARLSREPEMPADLGERWRDLLTAMTAREPDDRPSAEEVEERAAQLGPLGDLRASARREARETPTPTRVMAAAADEPTVALHAAVVPAVAAPGTTASSAAGSELDELFAAGAAETEVEREPGSTPRKRAGVIALVGGVVVALLLILWMVLATLASGNVTTPSPDPVVTTDGSNPAPATDGATNEQTTVDQTGTDDSGAEQSAPDGSTPVETTPVETTPVESATTEPVGGGTVESPAPVVDQPAPETTAPAPAPEPSTPAENPNKGPGNSNGGGNGNGGGKGPTRP